VEQVDAALRSLREEAMTDPNLTGIIERAFKRAEVSMELLGELDRIQHRLEVITQLRQALDREDAEDKQLLAKVKPL
jgi:cell division FtsZ-interacting protein ZapD